MKPQLAPKFSANGNDYVIMEYLSIARHSKFNNIVPKMVFGTDFNGMFAFMSDIYKLSTSGESPIKQLHQISLKAINMMDSVKNIKENDHEPFMEMAALFINRVDEDHSTITDQMIQDKINDWKIAGFDPYDFFLLAINSVSGLKDRWKELNGNLQKVVK